MIPTWIGKYLLKCVAEGTIPFSNTPLPVCTQGPTGSQCGAIATYASIFLGTSLCRECAHGWTLDDDWDGRDGLVLFRKGVRSGNVESDTSSRKEMMKWKRSDIEKARGTIFRRMYEDEDLTEDVDDMSTELVALIKWAQKNQKEAAE